MSRVGDRERRRGIGLPAVQARGSAAIAAQLRQAITEGVFSHGERLPAEREMARSFGASRMTVRTALDQLEEHNLIQRKVGSGTFVVHDRGFSDHEIADITSPLELMDMRQAVEPSMVRLAVLHGTARDLEALAQKLRRLEQAQADRDQFTRCDQDFHMAIASATHNPLAMWIYRQINEVRQHTQWSNAKDKVLTPARVTEYNRQHRALFNSIAGRHAESAMELMNRHLAQAKSDLIGAQSG
jgi:DNA-binding FadR family transcriptional regulator